MLQVQHAEVELDGLRFVSVCKICGEEHEGFLRGGNGGAVGVMVVIDECEVDEAALCGGARGWGERVVQIVGQFSLKGREGGRGVG